jgi:hypothetical protein
MTKTVKDVKRPNQTHAKRARRYLHISKTWSWRDTPGGKELVEHPGVTYSAGRRAFKDARAANKASKRAAYRAAKRAA